MASSVSQQAGFDLPEKHQPSTASSKSGIEKALNKGASWILSLQDQDGGFPFSFHDKVSIGAWPSSQAVAALLSLDPSMISELIKSLHWLQKTHQDFVWGSMKKGSKLLESTIWVAMAFLVANEIDENYEREVFNISDQIIANANNDGGWGSWKDDKSRIVISSQILSMFRQIMSHSASDKIQNSVNSAIDFLRKVQNADGGWGFSPSEKSNEVATSYALIGLSGVEICQDMIAKGIEWLEAEQTTHDRSRSNMFKREAVWRDDGIQRWSHFPLPIKLYALALNDPSTKWYKDLRYLLDIQESNGTWVDPDEPFLAFHTYISVYFLSKIKDLISLSQFERYCQLMDQIRREERASILVANRNKVKQIIMEDGLVFSESGFTLSSGEKSNYYYDIKRVLMNPVSVSLIGKLIWEEIRYDVPDAIGGLESGAIPMSISVVKESYESGQPIRAFFVRKSPREHGTKRWLEGNVFRGDRVIILEDVVTTGGSLIKTIERLKEHGCEISRIICIVDREENGRKRIESMGIKFESLFKHHEFEELV